MANRTHGSRGPLAAGLKSLRLSASSALSRSFSSNGADIAALEDREGTTDLVATATRAADRICRELDHVARDRRPPSKKKRTKDAFKQVRKQINEAVKHLDLRSTDAAVLLRWIDTL